MPWNIVRGDISRMSADAIVNAANSSLRQGSGVCGAIFAAAGEDELRRACDKIGHCETGSSVITPAFRLHARYIIHTVGPIWVDGQQGEEQLLRSAYESALMLAKENGCESMAFPLISAGIYGYPKEQALQIALQSFESFLSREDMEITLVIYDHSNPLSNRRLYQDVQRFVSYNYYDNSAPISYANCSYSCREEAPKSAEKKETRPRWRKKEAIESCGAAFPCPETDYDASVPAPSLASSDMKELERLLNSPEASFSSTLFRLIDEKGLKDVDVYKGANLDRKLFSKLRREDYHPSKYTVVALAISMKLSLDETQDLLNRAGLSFDRSSKFDIIAEYFLRNRIFDIFEINKVLFDFDQHLLGA